MRTKTNATAIQFIYDEAEPIEKKKTIFLKKEGEENLILPLRVITFLIAISGLFAMVYEVRYFSEYSFQVYLVRLSATLVSFFILIILYSRWSLSRPVLLVHVILLTIVLSSGYMILLIPTTLVLNSQIVGLMIFTSALFLSWDVKHQIITALYYYLVFAGAILLNDNHIYFMPNTLESVLFVGFMAFVSVIGSMVNFKLRSELAEKTVRVRLSERKFKAIIEHSAEGIFQSSPEGKFLTVNPALVAILGFDSEEELLAIENISELYEEPDGRAKLIDILQQTGEVQNYRLHLRKKNNEPIVVLLNDRLIGNKEEERYYFEGSLRDITAQEIMEREREEARDQIVQEKQRADELAKEAQKSSEIKSQFLANMSHEIRTPINGILGFLGLVENRSYKSENELKDFITGAKHSAETLLDLINDILDFSKIEAGKLQLEDRPFYIQKTLGEAVSIISPRANQKGLKILTQISRNTTAELVGDPVRLRQIYINLLSNAVKFTPAGEIRISVNLERINESELKLTSSVSDTGIGIEESKITQLFQPFSQLDGSYARKYGGTGLGLAICKELITLMGGEIQVESEYGRGTSFTFQAKFKLHKPDLTGGNLSSKKATKEEYVSEFSYEEIRTEKIKAQRKEFTILLAEDNVVNQKVIMRVLEDAGYKAFSVSNGIEVIEMLNNERRFDLILMDVQMPGMDGLTATGMIRNMNNRYRNIPIIALTAHALAGDREKCIAAGMDDYVTKPIRNDELINTIDGKMGVVYEIAAAPVKHVTAETYESPLFDHQYFDNISLSNKEFQKELMGTFLKDTERRIGVVKHAVEMKDYHTIGSEAHTIKGAGHSVGATSLGNKAAAIENAVKNEEYKELEELVTKLSDIYYRLRETVKEYTPG